MRRRITSLFMVFLATASLLTSTALLAGCPARRSSNPADLESAFLDRA